jgi:hypothetical protein
MTILRQCYNYSKIKLGLLKNKEYQITKRYLLIDVKIINLI